MYHDFTVDNFCYSIVRTGVINWQSGVALCINHNRRITIPVVREFTEGNYLRQKILRRNGVVPIRSQLKIELHVFIRDVNTIRIHQLWVVELNAQQDFIGPAR